jgi:hypothetical protein
MPLHESTDRVLIDMRGQRDDLQIQLSLMKDTQRTAPAEISRVELELANLDLRIARHLRGPES